MSPSDGPSVASDSFARLEAGLALGWFALHSGLQLVRPEGEVAHWASLVAVPLLLLTWTRRRRGLGRGLRDSLHSTGLDRGWKRGLGWAIPLGLALSATQLLLSRDAGAFLDLVASGRALVLFPIALLFLLATAGFTEEFFFRGVLQRRFARWSGSVPLGVALAAIAFALYHFPYALRHPAWPTFGDPWAALAVVGTEGLIGGLVLGAVYAGSRSNLVAAVVVHALIDVFPAMTMIRFGPE